MNHFLWKVADWFPKYKGGGRFICASTVFLLVSQVIRTFRLKDCLIILRAVTYVVRGRIRS